MNSPRRLALAVILGGAALSGTVALSKTVHLGADTPKTDVDAKAIARRHAQLTATERSARKALAQKTPGLPPVPGAGPVAVPNLGAVVVTRVVAPPAGTGKKSGARKPVKKPPKPATPQGEDTPVAATTPTPTPASTSTARRGDDSEAGREAREREAEAAEQAREAAKKAAEQAAEAAKKAAGGD
jgi:hypothetical protein